MIEGSVSAVYVQTVVVGAETRAISEQSSPTATGRHACKGGSLPLHILRIASVMLTTSDPVRVSELIPKRWPCCKRR